MLTNADMLVIEILTTNDFEIVNYVNDYFNKHKDNIYDYVVNTLNLDEKITNKLNQDKKIFSTYLNRYIDKIKFESHVVFSEQVVRFLTKSISGYQLNKMKLSDFIYSTFNYADVDWYHMSQYFEKFPDLQSEIIKNKQKYSIKWHNQAYEYATEVFSSAVVMYFLEKHEMTIVPVSDTFNIYKYAYNIMRQSKLFDFMSIEGLCIFLGFNKLTVSDFLNRKENK